MSPADVQTLVEKFFRHVASGELPPAMAMMAEDAILIEPPDLPFGGIYRGPRGLAEFARKIPRTIRVAATLTDVRAMQDMAALRMSVSFECRRSGQIAETGGVELYQVTDGSIARVEVFYGKVLAIRELIGASQSL